MDSRNRLLDGGACGCHVLNTTGQSVLCGNMDCCYHCCSNLFDVYYIRQVNGVKLAVIMFNLCVHPSICAH